MLFRSLTYKAEELGYHSQIILSGRRINDDMGRYVAENLVKSLIKADKRVRDAKVALLGFTFKENCPDTRNTRVIDIVNELKEYGIQPVIADPIADKEEAKREYNIVFTDFGAIQDMDAVIVAVAHEAFLNMPESSLAELYKKGDKKVLLDIKGLLNRQEFEKDGYLYWRL